MGVAAFTKFDCFSLDVGKGVHKLDSDALAIALTNTAPSVSASKVLSDITEISGNGYTAGGITVPNTAFGGSGGTATLTGDAVTFTASGGVAGPARYAVLYNKTAAGKNLIAMWDYGSSGTFDTLTVNENSESTGGTILTLS